MSSAPTKPQIRLSARSATFRLEADVSGEFQRLLNLHSLAKPGDGLRPELLAQIKTAARGVVTLDTKIVSSGPTAQPIATETLSALGIPRIGGANTGAKGAKDGTHG